ncbi:putative ribonuclease H-like domain-containing protein, partial [Tanacetum coccineum]
LKLDLSYSGLDEFKEPEFKAYGSEVSEQESNVVCDKKSDDSKENSDESLVKEQVSKDTSSFVESSLNVDKETVFPVDKKVEIVKPKNHEKPVKKSVRPVNTAYPKPIVYSAKSMSQFSKQAQSTAQRPFYKQTALTRRSVHTAKRHYYTERPRAGNTARSYTGPVNAVRAKGVNAVKTSTCWVWRPTKPNGASLAFKRHNYIDARGRSNGCSRHMTRNIAYLLYFKEFDGGCVTFGGGAHSGRISGKGTLKTNSIDFEDVYFVNELKINLFSVLRMCDKKNYVLFTDIECLVLSPNFKLPDENQILLKIPRKDNMYSFDMKNIIPKESLTCLVAKATLDESMLWHRRLGVIMEQSLRNKVMDDFCREKGIRREYSVARTPQQNGVAERRNRTLIETARTIGFKPALSFMKPFGCHVTILNILDHLSKFDGKSDEDFFAGYSLSSNAFKWLFDIDSLTQSMNYVPVAAGTFINESTGTQGELNASTSTQKEDISQDCVVMPIWKDASYFDSPTKDVDNGEPKSTGDDKKQDGNGLDNENDKQDKFEDDSSTKEVNTAGQHINTASPEVNTGHFKLNTIGPSVNTASLNDQDSPKDMFKIGASHTLEATLVEFYSDEDELEVDLGNITNS